MPTCLDLENQRCPFEGVYTVEAPMESDLSYNPSNIFMCPRQSFLTAQCDHPSRLKIHFRCTPARFLIKSSWTTNGLVRLLLADDERQRYSAWYRDYGTLPGIQEQSETTTTSATNNYAQAQALALQQQQAPTRSQHLLGMSSSMSLQTTQPTMTTTNSIGNAQYNSLTAPIVDLQIGLLTPLPTISKPMQVRLTRRNQCSDLRGYSSQGSYGGVPASSLSSSSMQSYASSATSPAISSASSIVILFHSASSFSSSILILLVTLALILQHSRPRR